MLFTIVLLIQVTSGWAMIGLIWFVQVVHYPLFAAVGKDHFLAYERQHMTQTTWVVAPLMFTELFSGIGLLAWCIWQRLWGLEFWIILINLLLILSLWAWTFLIMVPLHARLSKTVEPKIMHQLTMANIPRTIVWSLKGLLMTSLLLIR